jgi:hypothetical protein
MKLNIKRFFTFKVLILILVLFIPALSHADPLVPEDPGSDPDVPIDGGLSVLLAAGVGYGVRELRKKRLNQK